jgi:hypothetical protein
MAKLYGRTISKADLSRRVGQMSQIAGARACELTSGRAKGVEAIDIRTGTGFEFTVLPGRALDIAWVSYKGIQVSYVSKTGVVAAPYFEEKGFDGFLRNFFAGLLTTGGLANIGVPCQDGDESLGLHGRISNTPAEDVCVSQGWQGDEYVIRDVVENAGSKPEPLMLLYHCNFGYLIVSAATRLHTSSGSIEPRDAVAATGTAEHDRFIEPQAGYVEQCFYHTLKAKDGRAFAALFNEGLGIGAYVRYRVETLPRFLQWKMMGEHEYVVGLEPATGRLDGRAELLRQGQI